MPHFPPFKQSGFATRVLSSVNYRLVFVLRKKKTFCRKWNFNYAKHSENSSEMYFTDLNRARFWGRGGGIVSVTHIQVVGWFVEFGTRQEKWNGKGLSLSISLLIKSSEGKFLQIRWYFLFVLSVNDSRILFPSLSEYPKVFTCSIVLIGSDKNHRPRIELFISIACFCPKWIDHTFSPLKLCQQNCHINFNVAINGFFFPSVRCTFIILAQQFGYRKPINYNSMENQTLVWNMLTWRTSTQLHP